MTGTGASKKTAIHSIAMVVLFFAQWLISMLLVLAALVVLDSFNPSMGFLNSDVSKVFYSLLCVVGLFTAVCLAWQEN